MAHVISFSTERFDISKETENPFNPIAGEGVLNWIRGKLAGTPYNATEPQSEDWGWYIDVEGNGSNHLVGASGEADHPFDWIVQVEKHRSLKDKLMGQNKMTTDDPLAVLLASFIRGEPDFREVTVEHSG